MSKKPPKFGGLNERTVRVAENPMSRRWYVTVSHDGHNVTAVPVYDGPHRDHCDPLVEVYRQAGYTVLTDHTTPS